MQLGELMAILGISGSLLPSIVNLALISIPINEAKIAFNRMFEFAAIEKEFGGDKKVKEFLSLTLKDLSFRFAGRKQLLNNVNLTLNKGSIVAVVGESGCGKSTLGQIIQKFYSIESGSIIVNNEHLLQDVTTESWRNMIGVIPQDIHIFNGSVLDNILLGEGDDPRKVVDFCKTYGFEKFIADFPQGYATILGEEGVNLSGGQKQIIALARVLYKKPQILILDEATSAMDRRTENFTMSLLKQLKNDMGVFFISHRLQTLKNIADCIYIVDNGRIIESGSHNELLETNNFYSEYWEDLLPKVEVSC